MKLIDAIWDQIQDNEIGLISDYDLFKLYVQLLKDRAYNGKPLRTFKTTPEINQFKRFRASMIKNRMLTPIRGVKSSVYNISGGKKYSVEDFCCYADPFCYVSHFSALQRYRLTNRNPTTITLSTPSRNIWNKCRLHFIDDELSNQKEQSIALHLLVKIGFRDKVMGRSILFHNTSSPCETIIIKNSSARIPVIGDLFVQTLDRPQWCGGIVHVLEIWKEHASTYIDEIISSVEKSTSKIVKVRAGYILEEYLNISDNRIASWVNSVGRGSSRKLDPAAPYMPVYSEKWMLSINV